MRPDDPSLLTPSERRFEHAPMFAAGILRLNTRAALPSTSTPESPPTGLEVSLESRLSVHRG